MAGGIPEDTKTIADYEAILEVCRLYAEGGSKGDAAVLVEAFHPDARVFGDAGGRRLDVRIDEFIKIACAAPIGQGGRYRARIVTVDQRDDIATAVVAEDGCWGQASFIDHLSLVRFDGVWKIVGKTFTLTGGKIPS